MKTLPAFFRIFLTAMCICLMASCSKSVEPEPEPTKPTLSLNPSSPISFSADGGKQRVVISTNQDEWNAWSDQEWCKLTNDDFDLIIYADANTSKDARTTATVTVEVGPKGNTITKTITVNQVGKQEEPDPDPETTHITKDGGTVKFDDLQIVVPSGGFQKDADVKVEKVSSDMGEYAASQYYKVTLPADFGKGLTLKLAAQGSLSGDVFTRLSSQGWAKSMNKSSDCSNMLKATADGNTYSVVLEPFVDEGLDGQTAEFTIGLVKGYSSITSSQQTKGAVNDSRFQIVFPATFIDQSYYVLEWCNEAYDALESYWNGLGLGFFMEKRIDVEVFPFGGEDATKYGYFSQSILSDQYCTVYINSNLYGQPSEMKRTIIHELCHYTQTFFDTRFCYTKAKSGGPFLWMDEAVAVWTESYFGKNAPSVQMDNYWVPLNGFDLDGGEDAADHGYGMAALIRWMEMRGDNYPCLTLHAAQKSGAESVFDAFQEGSPDVFNDYIIFLNQYMLGEIYDVYNNGKENNLMFLTAKKFVFSKPEEEKEQKMEMRPYSAFISRIQVKSDFDVYEGSQITLEATGGSGFCSVYKFDTEKQKVVYVDDFYDTYVIPDAEKIAKDKEDYFVVHYNTMSSSVEASLKAKIGLPDYKANIGYANLFINDCLITKRSNNADGEVVVNTYTKDMGFTVKTQGDNSGKITYQTNSWVYDQTWDFFGGVYYHTGTIHFTVNKLSGKIEDGYVEYKDTTEGGSYGYKYWRIKNIPCIEQSEDKVIFEINFSEANPGSSFYSDLSMCEYSSFDDLIYEEFAGITTDTKGSLHIEIVL